MKIKALVATCVVALVVVFGAQASATRSSLSYAGVFCQGTKSVEVVCERNDQTGYAVGIGQSYLLVVRQSDGIIVWHHKQRLGVDQGVPAPSAINFTYAGVFCTERRSNKSIACLLHSITGYDFGITLHTLVVLNADTGQTVFSKYTP